MLNKFDVDVGGALQLREKFYGTTFLLIFYQLFPILFGILASNWLHKNSLLNACELLFQNMYLHTSTGVDSMPQYKFNLNPVLYYEVIMCDDLHCNGNLS